MSNEYPEGRLKFVFSDELRVFRPGTSAYYTRHFQRFCGGSKETDFTAWDESARTLWLIEVKDYSTSARTKTLDLFDEVAQKVRDTLALLASATANANPDKADTREFSRSCLPADRIRVVLHLELSARPSNKLHPPLKLGADATQTLRMKLRCIDSHALVVSKDLPSKVPWRTK
jgi:hypothetical protein